MMDIGYVGAFKCKTLAIKAVVNAVQRRNCHAEDIKR